MLGVSYLRETYAQFRIIESNSISNIPLSHTRNRRHVTIRSSKNLFLGLSLLDKVLNCTIRPLDDSAAFYRKDVKFHLN
jgi:hypothetical protein